jgi:hypothetical protein
MMKSILLAIVMISSVTSAQGQTGQELAKRTIKVGYDRFKDVTSVSTGLLAVRGPGSTEEAMARVSAGASVDWITVNIVAAYPGRTPAKPEFLAMALGSVFKAPRFVSDRNLILLLDGERIRLGDMNFEGGSDISGYHTEMLTIVISYQTFLKMANGRSVEGQVGDVEFSFNGGQLQLLRDLNSHLSN